MALRQIRLLDDEILRKKSRPVEVVDDRIRQILNDMADTMYHSDVNFTVVLLHKEELWDRWNNAVIVINTRRCEYEYKNYYDFS